MKSGENSQRLPPALPRWRAPAAPLRSEITIDSALAVLVRVLNRHPQKSLSLTEPVVPAAPVVDLDGLEEL